jgi:hypothetical protein
MDYSYYSINQVPLVTYGMIAITTGVLAFVAMADAKENDSGSEGSGMGLGSLVSGSEDQSAQTGGKKKNTKQKHAKLHKKHTTKRHR